MTDYLSQLEADAIYAIREAACRCRHPGVLWSCGKDSTALLWLCRKAFLGSIPFPVVHIDTSYKFDEIYQFRDRLADEWQLDLHVIKNADALAQGMGPTANDPLQCCQALKTDALKHALDQLQLDAALVGIRRDEHGIRAKERRFSQRRDDFSWPVGRQPPELWEFYTTCDPSGHLRIHPLLDMLEVDVWRYTQREDLPVCPLYFADDGKRYRSIGCQPCCCTVDSDASTIDQVIAELQQDAGGERAGRSQDKEGRMQKLRALGYM